MNCKPNSEKTPANIRQTLQALKPVSPPDHEVWQVNRQAFLAEITLFQRQLTAQNTAVVRNQTGLKYFFLKEKSIMAIAIKAIIVLSLMLGGSFGTAKAAEGSVPGSLLYPIKMQLENWQLNITHEPLRQAMLALKFAQHRMDEVTTLMNRGDNVPSEVAQRYQEQIKTALQAGDALPEPLQEQIRSQLQKMLANHTQIMTQLRLRTREDGECEEPLQSMIRVMEQTQAQLSLQNGQGGQSPDNPPEDPGKGPGNTDQGQGPGDEPGNETPPKQGEGDGTGPNPDPGTPPDEKPGQGSQDGSGPPAGAGSEDKGNDEPPSDGQGPANGPGDSSPPAEIPGSGPPNNAGEGNQDCPCDTNCTCDANCSCGEGDGNNGAGDNGGQDGGEPSGGDNSGGDNTGGDNSGGDNGGDGGNDSGNGGGKGG
jgi:uncharacterized membrane protein YgcG